MIRSAVAGVPQWHTVFELLRHPRHGGGRV